MPHAN